MSILLGVNIDHVATVRQARKSHEPSVLEAARISAECGVNAITMHLREDRRHIQDKDVYDVRSNIKCQLNLEMSLAEGIIKVAKDVRPDMATLVPERREEVTTEGGLNVVANFSRIKSVCEDFANMGILVSLFIEPEEKTILLSAEAGAKFVEFHTGAYANAWNTASMTFELDRLMKAAEIADRVGLNVNAGHGLNYENIFPVMKMKKLHEVNIGHSIISRAVFTGLERAVKDMIDLLKRLP